MMDAHGIYDENGIDFLNEEYSDGEEGFTVENYAKFAGSDDEDCCKDHKMTGGAEKQEVLSYDPYEFVSKCCRAFIFYDKLSIYCSKCGKEVDKIEPGQAIKISVKFNSTTEETSISGDVLRAFQNSLPRFATDPTCELCERKCKKCSTKMRYLRDRKGDMWYVCSNKDCRHVDSPNDTIVGD